MNTEYLAGPDDRILVTGASGFIGARVVERLLAYGFSNLCCFVRPSSDLRRLNEVLRRVPTGAQSELVAGDLTARDDCARATEGASIVYHLAAGFDKSFAGAFMNSALATRNVMDAFLERGHVKRFVNVSSFAVYSNLTLKRGALLDETCPLEDAPQERYDAYGFGKLKQEQLVRHYGSARGLPFVILRPGAVFGPGKKTLNGRIGIDTFGCFIQVAGSNLVPLTFVDNCAEAIVLAGLTRGIDGEVFNVVDDNLLTSRQFLQAYQQRTGHVRTIRIPYGVASGLCRLWERYSKRSRGQLPPAFNRRRCAAEWKGNRFSNQKLRQRLGWRPKVEMSEAMTLFLDQFERDSSSS
jgi:nucleoside-diphosphate-sugar epimerase